jgi:predicted transcriptional regulator of viral defense system
VRQCSRYWLFGDAEGRYSWAGHRRFSNRSLAAFVDDLQARGRYTFTREEAQKIEPRSHAALKSALRRLKQRGRIVSPRRGFYVLVPAEYRAAGCPPASWFIDDLMRFAAAAGYLNNVATVLGELAKKVDASRLAKLAKKIAVPDVQRLGYLLEQVGASALAEPLATWLKKRRYRSVLLAPWQKRTRKMPDAKWRVTHNESVEADV